MRALVVALLLLAAEVRAQSVDDPHAHLALAALYDLAGYSQDHTSVNQVGDLATNAHVRTDRVMLDGAFKVPVAWQYTLAIDYNGVRSGSRPAFTINDLAFTFPIGQGVDLAIGRQKEGVTSEVMATTRTLALTERPTALTSIFPARSDGIRLMGGKPTNGRWSVGWFNRHPLASGPTPAGGNDFAGRVFFARGGATDEKRDDKSRDSTAVIHLGATAAWSGAVNDSLRFRAKPEVNSAPNFVDTKSFPSHGAATLGLDALAQRRNVSLISEVLVTRATVVHRAPSTFVGYYAEASWRPTGEPRSYDASRGTFGRVTQRAQRGAFEVGARFSHTDLSSGTLDGGVFDRVSGVASWYSRWSTRLDVGYGLGTLTRDGATGHTHFFIMRAQWELL